MYDRDMPKLAAHGLASPEGFVDVVTFVLLTIQQPLSRVREQFADVKAKGADSVWLFAAKGLGYLHVQKHKLELHARVRDAIYSGDTVDGIDALLDVPSLGIVKAAFVMQCLGAPDAACIDTHNAARYGYSYSALKFSKAIKKPATRLRKIRAYLDLCAKHGDARQWWNEWCAYVVEKNTGKAAGFLTASLCSREHVRALGLS